MYYEKIADVTDNIKTLGGLKAVLPNVQSFNAAVARINSKKQLPTYIKLIVERGADADGDALVPFIFFDVNEVSGVENGTGVETTTDYPGGMDALVSRLRDSRCYFAGISYEATDISVYRNLALESFVTDGINKVRRNIQSEFIDAGRVNDGLIDATLRTVAIFGELAPDTALIGQIGKSKRLEMILQMCTY